MMFLDLEISHILISSEMFAPERQFIVLNS